MNHILKLTLAILFVLLLEGCGGSALKKSTEVGPTPSASSTAAPTAISGITLTYGDNAQVELVTPSGRHVYIDIYNTSLLTKQPDAGDILLTTHLHSDHYLKDFQASFPGKQIFISVDEIKLPDISIVSIASAHLPSDPITAKGATDYLFVIDTGGLRIAHFGDIGQEALTDVQLAALGSVDLAITQFSNSYSLMDSTNRKGFHLMDQVKPRLIIPTHADKSTMEIAFGQWTGYYSGSRTVVIAPEKLPATTGILYLGNPALTSAYAKIYNLKEWK